MKFLVVLIMSFIFVGTVGSIVGMYSYYIEANSLLEERVVLNLEFVAQSLENFIEEVLEEQKEKLKIAATHQELSSEEFRTIIELQEEFSEIFVLDSEGKVVASSDESQVGKDKSGAAYFINVREDVYVEPAYFSETTQKESIAISVPFHEDVLVARIDLDSFNEFVSDRTGLGETGEVSLAYRTANGSVFFLTERRFEEEAVDEREKAIGILPIEKALDKEEGVVYGLFDYRNVEVLAVTRYIDEMDVGLVVKIDEAEALGIVRNQLIRRAIVIVAIIIIFVSLVGWIVSFFILNPIKKLALDVDEITKGKLEIQLEKSSIFEVQNLADSLNRILASLKLAILRTGSSGSFLCLGDECEVPVKKISGSNEKKVFSEKNISKDEGGKKDIPLKK